MTSPEDEYCIDLRLLQARVASVVYHLTAAITHTGPLAIRINSLENRLSTAHLAYLDIVTKDHDDGVHCQVCHIQSDDARLVALAVELRRAHLYRICVLQKIASGELRRKGNRGNIPGNIVLSRSHVDTLDQIILHLASRAIGDSEVDSTGSVSVGALTESGHPDGDSDNSGNDDSADSLPPVTDTESERDAGQHRQQEEMKDAVVLGLGQSIKDQAQAQADAEVRWEAEIRELRALLGDQQRQIEVMRSEKVAAAEAESVKREEGLALLRNELQVQKIEAEKTIAAEVKALKEELSALRATVSASVGTSHTGIVNSLTKVDIESLGRLILSSDPFTSTIPRLLRLTIGHTLALSVGCFPVEHPERVLQISNACDSHHTLAALGVLHDLPSWAGQREQIFRQLVKEALEGQADAEPDCTELDMAMLSMLSAQRREIPKRKDEEANVGDTEEHEKLKSAWKDVVGAITAQGQSTLGEITQHLALAIDHITSAKAEALLSIDMRHQAASLDLGHRADQLDHAMLEFDRLHLASHSLPEVPATPTKSLPITPSTNQDFSTVITLLEQLVSMQQPSFPTYTSSHSPQNTLKPSASTTSLDTTHALATGSSSIHPSANAALNSAAGPRVTGPIWTDDLWYSPARMRM